MATHNYFDTDHAIIVHDTIIRISGGTFGVLNLGLLESVLEHIKNDNYYPLFEDKLTHLFYSVNKNHAFCDGNKRSSIALSTYFMEVNGLGYRASDFMTRMENIVVDVADNKINKELLSKIVFSFLYEEDFSETLKMELIAAKSR
jgi:death on curing protein